MAASPLVLTYRNLREDGSIHAEPMPGGGTKITAAAMDLTPAMRHELLLDTALGGAIASAIVLGGCVLFFGVVALSNRRMLPWSAAVVFIVFCMALFAMVWRLLYVAAIERAELALQQQTVLTIEPDCIAIESNGPVEWCSHRLRSSLIRGARVGRVTILAGRHEPRPVRCLEIQLTDRRALRLLPARHSIDLAFVARFIDETALSRDCTIP